MQSLFHWPDDGRREGGRGTSDCPRSRASVRLGDPGDEVVVVARGRDAAVVGGEAANAVAALRQRILALLAHMRPRQPEEPQAVDLIGRVDLRRAGDARLRLGEQGEDALAQRGY